MYFNDLIEFYASKGKTFNPIKFKDSIIGIYRIERKADKKYINKVIVYFSNNYKKIIKVTSENYKLFSYNNINESFLNMYFNKDN